MTYETRTLISDLDSSVVSLIENWLGHADRKKSHLCKLANFRPHSLNDILARKSTLANYHPMKVLRLLSVLEGKEINYVLEKYRPAISEIENRGNFSVSETIDIELSTDKVFTDNFVEAMKNPVALAIYTMSTSTEGVTNKELNERFGSYSKDIISDLIQKRIIVEIGATRTKYYAINREMLNLTRVQVQKIIPSLNESYKVSHSGKGRNYIYFRVDSINKAALYKIHEAYAQLENTITEILEDESHKGRIPFYGFSQMDTFTEEID